MANKFTPTDNQLKAMCENYQKGSFDKIAKARMGYWLMATGIAHSIPSTASEAKALSIRIVTLAGAPSDHNGAQLHYGLAKGGLWASVGENAAKSQYNPTKYGKRTHTTHKWYCDEHGIAFTKCNDTCLHGLVTEASTLTNKVWLYMLVTKAHKASATETPSDNKAIETPSERNARLIKASNKRKRDKARANVEIAANDTGEVETSVETQATIDALTPSA